MRVCICNEKTLNESLHNNLSTFSIPHVNNFLLSVIFFGRFNDNFHEVGFKRLRRRFFINFMSEKLRFTDAVEMGIDKHMVASLCRLGNNAISMSLVSNFFSCMDISSFGCLIRS